MSLNLAEVIFAPQKLKKFGLESVVNSSVEQAHYLFNNDQDVQQLNENIKVYLAGIIQKYMLIDNPEVQSTAKAIWYDLTGEVIK